MSNQPTGNDKKQSRPPKHFGDRYWIDVVRGIDWVATQLRWSSISTPAAKYAVETATYGSAFSISAGTTDFMNHPRKSPNR
jgi:hypothetical protein